MRNVESGRDWTQLYLSWSKLANRPRGYSQPETSYLGSTTTILLSTTGKFRFYRNKAPIKVLIPPKYLCPRQQVQGGDVTAFLCA